jgi:hypothetical protein
MQSTLQIIFINEGKSFEKYLNFAKDVSNQKV